MNTLINEAIAIFPALFENDAWVLSQALQTNGAWLFGFFAMILGASLMAILYHFIPFIERHLERTIMVYTYLGIAAIIFVEVFRRFVLNEQVPWSTTLPPFLFLIMTWFSCSYNVKLRTHLAFSELRMKLPRNLQLFCLILDAILWIGFCWLVFVTSSKVTANSAANFQILLGTDDVLQWWFLITVPISFTLLATRVLVNLITDIKNYQSGNQLIKQAVIGSEA